MRNEARLRAVLEESAFEQLEEDLNHPAWVVLFWWLGREGGDEPSVFGPVPSEIAGHIYAEKLARRTLAAPGRSHFFGDVPVDFDVVPLWAEEPADL